MRRIIPPILLIVLLLFPPTIGVTPHTTQMDVPQAQIALVNDQVTVGTSEQTSPSLTIADYDVQFSIGTPASARDLGEMLEAIRQALEWWFRDLLWESGGWHGY